MLVVVTVEAQEFPVAAVGRVVVVVVIAMVYGKFSHCRLRELPSATPADPGVQPESLGPVTLFSFSSRPLHVRDQSIEFSFVGRARFCHLNSGWLQGSGCHCKQVGVRSDTCPIIRI